MSVSENFVIIENLGAKNYLHIFILWFARIFNMTFSCSVVIFMFLHLFFWRLQITVVNPNVPSRTRLRLFTWFLSPCTDFIRVTYENDMVRLPYVCHTLTLANIFVCVSARLCDVDSYKRTPVVYIHTCCWIHVRCSFVM